MIRCQTVRRLLRRIVEGIGRSIPKIYAREMKKLVNQTRKNQESGIISYETNQDLQEYLDKGLMKIGLNILFQNFMNKLRSPERQIMLP